MNTMKMKPVRTTLCSLVFMTLLALTCKAATYYVAPADKGGAAGNPGTKEQPFLKLSDAVAQANAAIIYLADGTNFVDSTVVIDKGLTIASESGDRDKCVLDGGNACRIIKDENYALELSGLTLQRGYADDGVGGAALYFSKNNRLLTIRNCVIRDCHVSYEATGSDAVRGGGLYAYCKADSEIVDTEIEGCTVSISGESITASCGGGGAYLENGTMRSCIVRGCAVTNGSPMDTTNTATPVTTLGGGLQIAGSSRVLSTVVSNCVVASTSSTFGTSSIGGAGGGIAFRNALDTNVSVVDCLIAGNVSDCAGGGIYVGGAGTVSNCTIRANEMSWPRSCGHVGAGGAGIAAYNANVAIVGCLVENNSATNATSLSSKSVCGGVSASEGSVYIVDSVIRDNAAYNGGGVRLYRTRSGTCVSNAVITGNRSWEQSGGIRADSVIALQLRDLIVTDNVQSRTDVSKPYGGILSITAGDSKNKYSEILLQNCLFAGNQAAGAKKCTWWGVYVSGGAYRAAGAAPITFDHCTFARNSTAANTSAAFFTVADQATATNVCLIGCAVYGNTANGVPVGIGSDTTLDWSLSENLLQYSLCDVVKDGFSLTAGNHNVDASSIEASALFANAEGGDYRPASGRSALVGAGGPFEDWMGTGSRKSIQDIGDGTYSLLTAETYGVSVVRNGTSPRRQGSASDIGCNELREAIGFTISFR